MLTDLLYLLADPGGSPLDRKMTLTQLRNLIADWIVLDAQEASDSATIDFTFDQTLYDELELTILNVVVATNAEGLGLRVGTGVGPTWAAGASDYSYTAHTLSGTATTGTHTTGADTTHSAMLLPIRGVSNVAGEAQSGRVSIAGIDGVTYPHMFGMGGGYEENDAQRQLIVSGRYNTKTALTGLRVLADAGNITSGKFILRGRLKVS